MVDRPGAVPRLQISSPGLRHSLSQGVESNLYRHQTLKVEFPGKLQTARRVGIGYPSEIVVGGNGIEVAKIGIRREKVRMVEGVKEFKAELETHGLREIPRFFQPHIPIDEARGTQVGQES